MGNDENLSEISNRASQINKYEVEMIPNSSSSEMSNNSPKRETFSSPSSPHIRGRDTGSTTGSHESQLDENNSLNERPEHPQQDEMMTVL